MWTKRPGHVPQVTKVFMRHLKNGDDVTVCSGIEGMWTFEETRKSDNQGNPKSLCHHKTLFNLLKKIIVLAYILQLALSTFYTYKCNCWKCQRISCWSGVFPNYLLSNIKFSVSLFESIFMIQYICKRRFLKINMVCSIKLLLGHGLLASKHWVFENTFYP